jgi:hypothetical protein
MTFDEYGQPYISWSALGFTLICVFSDPFLNVGSAEEPIDPWPRFTQHGRCALYLNQSR